MTSQSTGGGAGPLYEHTPEGEQAAKEEVVIPGSDDDRADDREDEKGKPTGEDQARVNREDDPPA
jgi:hypothetical protein